jgi:hypothetical protein
MAKVKMGVIVTGLRGTVGGLTFSANKAGNHAHTWTRSGNARSVLQCSRRQRLSINAQAWRSVSAGNQALWVVFAAALAQRQTDPLGNFYYLSGFQWYVKVNNWLWSCGRAGAATPPVAVVPAIPTVTGFQISVGASTCHFHYAANEFGATWDAVVFVGIGNGFGCIVPPGPMPFIVGSQVPGGTSLDFTTAFMSVFGAVFVGQRAFLRVHRQTTDGYRGAAASTYANVIA